MKIKHKISTICIIFTVITLLSPILNAKEGSITNLHLLSRLGITAIAVGSFYIFEWLDRLPKRIVELIHYGSSLLLVFGLVWLTGVFIEPLHPNAYRDIFLNYSAIYIFIAIFFEIKFYLDKKKIKNNITIINT